jgi:hypothetical protein
MWCESSVREGEGGEEGGGRKERREEGGREERGREETVKTHTCREAPKNKKVGLEIMTLTEYIYNQHTYMYIHSQRQADRQANR